MSMIWPFRRSADDARRLTDEGTLLARHAGAGTPALASGRRVCR
jgi:hypothetical protein